MAITYAQITSTEDQRPSGTLPVLITMNQNDEIDRKIRNSLSQK